MITSKENGVFKSLKKLKKDKEYLFLDNPKLIKEAISAGFEIEYVIICENSIVDNFLIKKAKQKIELSNSLFNSFTTTCASQGIIGIVKNKKLNIKSPSGNFLILDNLQDPGNVGTLLRSAVGANFKDIYLIDCVNALNEKLVRSSMGAIFKLNIYESSKDNFIAFANNNLKEKDIFVADMSGENVFNAKSKKQFGIILGNEGNGVSKEMYSIANKVVSIPMKNNLESLNVAVAGSILMFELSKNIF